MANWKCWNVTLSLDNNKKSKHFTGPSAPLFTSGLHTFWLPGPVWWGAMRYVTFFAIIHCISENSFASDVLYASVHPIRWNQKVT